MLKALCSIIIFAIFFIWSTEGAFYLPFTTFFPRFHILFLFVTLLTALLYIYAQEKVFNALKILVKSRYVVFPSLICITSIFINKYIYHDTPHPIDSAHFVWMAKMLLNGKIYLELPPFPEHYQEMFMVMYGGKYFSLFFPGFSVFLAPFIFFGVGFLLNPLSLAFSAILIGKIVQHVSKSSVASLLAMVFFTFSPFFLIIGATYFTHPFNLLLTLFCVYSILCLSSSSKYLIAGIAVGILVWIRPQNAFFTFVAVIIYLFYQTPQSLSGAELKKVVAFSFIPAVAGVLLLGYNYYFTGDFFIFPQDVFHALLDGNIFCHRFGLGKGCMWNNNGDLPKEGLTFSYAVDIMKTRLSGLLFRSTSHPVIFVPLLFFPFVFNRKYLLPSLIFTFYFIGYFFFFLPGNFEGPRYFFEVIPFLLIFSAHTIIVVIEKIITHAENIKKYLIISFISWVVLTPILFFATQLFPKHLKHLSTIDFTETNELRKLIQKDDYKNTLFFIATIRPGIYSILNPINMQETPPYDNRGNLFLWSLGQYDQYAINYYKKKGFNKIRWVVRELGEIAIKEFPIYPTEPRHIEPEFIRVPYSGLPKLAGNIYNSIENHRFDFSKDANIHFTGTCGFGVLFSPDALRNYYDIPFFVIDEGTYKMTIDYVSSSCGNDFVIYVNNDEKTVLKAFDYTNIKKSIAFTTVLQKDQNIITFVPKKDESCLILDNIQLKKLDAM